MATKQHRTRAARAPQLRYIRTLACDADRLWKLLTRPELLGEWLGTTVLSDTQYGGFTVATDAGRQHTGIVTTCEPPHYFQASWDDPPHPPSTLLVDVVPGRQDTHLILTQAGLRPALVGDHDRLWKRALDRLTQYVTRQG
ncbi:SRPBCC domain-containing protein [Kribbella sp. NPDC026611]|uniref:SRPBCC domain-containing protein n=1 Tax=Kribbella sp. NPDC026611 TaxID=3154911 RepID=UPI0033F4CF63